MILDAREGARRVQETLDGAIAVHQRVRVADLDAVVRAAEAIAGAFAAGGKVMAFGNGGSATDAEHLVAELVGRFQKDRRGLPAIALTAASSVVTSIGNDFGFDAVFARQIEALGRDGDVAFGITASGGSANVVAALSVARDRGLRTIALTGRDGGAAGRAAQLHINVPEQSVARVQEVHRTLIHAICELVEAEC